MKLELVKNSGKVSLFVDDSATEFVGDEEAERMFDHLRDKVNGFMRSYGEGSLVIKVDSVLTVESDK